MHTDSRQNTILVVEDDPDILSLLLFNLEKDGHTALGANSGEDGLALFTQHHPDLVILDLMLPGMDGMAVCRRMRKDPDAPRVPILMLTARGGDDDVVAGLETGADDYVAKPFSPRVLLARVRTLLRRGADPAGPSDAEMRVDGILLNPARREVHVHGQKVDLTAGEFKTLQVLMRRPGVVFSRTQLLDLVRGSLHAVTDRAVDVQVAGLRKKLGPAGQCVETVRGAGYRIAREEEPHWDKI